VVLADDSGPASDGLSALLAGVPDIRVIGRARDDGELSILLADLRPDTALISLRKWVVSTKGAVVAARRLRIEHPDVGIVIVASRGERLAEALEGVSVSRVKVLADKALPARQTVVDALRAVRADLSILEPAIVDWLLQPLGDIDTFTGQEVDLLDRLAHWPCNQTGAIEPRRSMNAIQRHINLNFRELGLSDSSEVDPQVIATFSYLRTQTILFSSRAVVAPKTRPPAR